MASYELVELPRSSSPTQNTFSSSSSLDQITIDVREIPRRSLPVESIEPAPRKGSIEGEPEFTMVWSRWMFKGFYVATLGALITEFFALVATKVWLGFWLVCTFAYPAILGIFVLLAIISSYRGYKKSVLPWQFTPTQLTIILSISEVFGFLAPMIAYFIEPIYATFFLPTIPLVCFSCFLFLTSYWHPGLPMKLASDKIKNQALQFEPKNAHNARIYIVQDLVRTAARMNVILDQQWIAQVFAPRFTCIDVAPGKHTLVVSLAGVHALFYKEAVVPLDLVAGEVAIINAGVPARWAAPVTTKRNDTEAMKKQVAAYTMTLPWMPMTVSARDLDRARAAAAGSDLRLTLPPQQKRVRFSNETKKEKAEEPKTKPDIVEIEMDIIKPALSSGDVESQLLPVVVANEEGDDARMHMIGRRDMDEEEEETWDC